MTHKQCMYMLARLYRERGKVLQYGVDRGGGQSGASACGHHATERM